MSLENLDKYKQDFLKIVTRLDHDRGAINAINTAVIRGDVYRLGLTESERSPVRDYWSRLLRSHAEGYYQSVSSDRHCDNIVAIAHDMTAKFPQLLRDGKMRFGNSQKAFNMYLKTLWCMEELPLTPPHCPVDGEILRKAGITGTWTKLDSVPLYTEWVTRLEKVASSHRMSLSEWELFTWAAATKK